jgi:deoxyribodipyrimidine photo-lyase
VSNKQEYSARTIRPKIHALLPSFAVATIRLKKHPYHWPGTYMTFNQLSLQINDLLNSLKANGTSVAYIAGEQAARSWLSQFIHCRLKGYASNRNDPTKDGLSGLSPYLHFGHISSLTVLLELQQAVQLDSSLQIDVDALIEELIVRKELSDNYCHYNNKYNTLHGAPAWAQATLAKHASDTREYLYTANQFEMAQTHDKAWNAAQQQLRTTGKMHGYMRMYWAKKVLEWSPSPAKALSTLIYLNDFYALDGGDPNGYTGILWSIAGLHDRPWGERPIYGTVRCMVYGGLKRKFDIQAYIDYY